jgi:hypothetical protein
MRNIFDAVGNELGRKLTHEEKERIDRKVALEAEAEALRTKKRPHDLTWERARGLSTEELAKLINNMK